MEAFQIVESGNLDIKVEYEKDNEFRYLFTAFHSMLGRIRNLIDQVYKQKILYQRSELKQLQSQINPHFLYNSYFVLNDMAVNEDYENLAEFSRQMGIYFQYITRNASSKPCWRKRYNMPGYTRISRLTASATAFPCILKSRLKGCGV